MFLNNLVQKAQSLIDPALSPLSPSAEKRPSKAALFRHQFHLPDSESPLHEITTELTVPLPYKSPSPQSPYAEKPIERSHGNVYAGKLHISENYLCFSTQNTSFQTGASLQLSSAFTGQTHGAGPAGNGFTLPLCAIRKVERLPTTNSLFALAMTTWNGSTIGSKSQDNQKDLQRFTLQLAGSRQACDRFCDGLKKGLRNCVKQVDSLRVVVGDCYSEYMLAGVAPGPKEAPKTPDTLKDTKSPPPPDTPVRSREPPDTGLGTVFRYPGDPRKLRDRSKMRLWAEYFRDNGRNATLIRQPTFHKLIRVGLPNRLRGEIWEITSGSLFVRLQDPQLYTKTLSKFTGRDSLAIDEIEKDLNRSLPEYPGFQSEEGIGRLRRVLTAYSWIDAEVGYCQAMNIVVAALLIYMSEAQAFSILSVLCDRLLPGYYSQTMYGTLLDQKVFESLVERTMPILWEHLTKTDVQLSVVSLPWFLSLYINSMPLVFAFRILDVFFLEGPKVLFQVGLAILRINGEELLDVTDDGTFISILKTYFSRLDESAHPNSENAKLKAVTKFQELMVVAIKEFSGITQSTISDQRAKHKESVLDNIESFAKRTSIRNLGPDSKRLSPSDLSLIYDRYHSILYEQEHQINLQRQESLKSSKSGNQRATEVVTGVNAQAELGRVGIGSSPELMNYDGYRELLAGVAKWAVADTPRSPPGDSTSEKDRWLDSSSAHRSNSISSVSSRKSPEPADHDFMQRLFGHWNKDDKDGLTLQNVVSGLADIKGSRDLMGTLAYFFNLYDDDKDGRVDREGILRISETLLFLSRRGLEGNFTLIGSSPSGLDQSIPDDTQVTVDGATLGEKFLNSVSGFIRRCFEYAEPDQSGDGPAGTAAMSSKLEQFAIGDDEDEETTEPTSHEFPANGEKGTTISNPASPTPSKKAANLALDPAHPLHITLPTFRMVILADELLQQFFEFSFADSFHTAPEAPIGKPPPFSLQTPTLTTFSGLNARHLFSQPQPSPNPSTPNTLAPPTANAPITIPSVSSLAPQSSGLRGILDNIVTDGMRVAAEVRKRMDELERNALAREEEEDEDEEDEAAVRAGFFGQRDPEKRERDQDLLDAVDVGTSKEQEGLVDVGDGKSPTTPRPEGRKSGENLIEFES